MKKIIFRLISLYNFKNIVKNFRILSLIVIFDEFKKSLINYDNENKKY